MRSSMFSISAILAVACILAGLCTPLEVVNAQTRRQPVSPTTTQPVSPTTTQPASTNAEELNNIIVMIKCQIGEDESFGAGIIFGKRSNRLYIATANHVVRRGPDEGQKVRVQLRWMPGEWKPAELLDSTDRDLDLAVLAIDLSREGVQVDALQWNQLGDPALLKSGDSVYSLGYPNGKAWRTYERPNTIYRNSGSSIIFETDSVAPGNSGGALLNQRREIVGMIREFESTDGRAISIQSVIETLKEWAYPVNLRPRGESVSTTTGAAIERPAESSNVIYNFRAQDVSGSELWVAVDYKYSGSDPEGDRVTLQAFLLKDDINGVSESTDYSEASQVVPTGGDSVLLKIKATGSFTTSIVRISMVKNRSIVAMKDFPYTKVWGSQTTTGERPATPRRRRP